MTRVTRRLHPMAAGRVLIKKGYCIRGHPNCIVHSEAVTISHLTKDERDDKKDGHHYERQDGSLLCICGDEWVCSEWARPFIEYPAYLIHELP